MELSSKTIKGVIKMYQVRNLLTNQVTVSGKVRHIYFVENSKNPNSECTCGLLDIITGTNPAERVKIVLYKTQVALYRSLGIEAGDFVEVQGNIQSSLRSGGRSTQSVIANSLKRLYFSPMN